MPEAGVFSFNSGHVGFSHQMVCLLNEAGVDAVAICDIPKASPPTHELPQRFEALSTTISHNPSQNARTPMIDNTPHPNFIFFTPDERLKFISFGYFGNLTILWCVR